MHLEIPSAPATGRRIYIVGPMSGYPDFNRPAFAEAEERLRAAVAPLGFRVFRRRQRKTPNNNGGTTHA